MIYLIQLRTMETGREGAAGRFFLNIKVHKIAAERAAEESHCRQTKSTSVMIIN